MSSFGKRAIGAKFAIACVVATTLMPVPAAPGEVAYDWSGFYFGGHVGYGRGTATSTVFDPAATTSGNSFGSLFVGPFLPCTLLLLLLTLERQSLIVVAGQSHSEVVGDSDCRHCCDPNQHLKQIGTAPLFVHGLLHNCEQRP